MFNDDSSLPALYVSREVHMKGADPNNSLFFILFLVTLI